MLFIQSLIAPNQYKIALFETSTQSQRFFWYILVCWSVGAKPINAQPSDKVKHLLEDAKQTVAQNSVEALTRAIEIYNQALSIQEEPNKEGALQRACIYELMSDIYVQFNDWENALKSVNRTLFIRETYLDSLDFDVLPCYLKIGNIMLCKSKYDSATIMYEKGLHRLLRRADDQRKFRSIETFYTNIALCYEKSKVHKSEYVPTLLKALDLLTKLEGRNNKEVAGLFMSISTYYIRNGPPDSALYYALRSYDVMKKSISDEKDPKFGQICYTVGQSWAGLGQVDSAETMYKKAAAILKDAFGEADPDLAQVYTQLGSIRTDHQLMNRWYLLTALDILESSEQDTREKKLILYNNLAYHYASTHEYEKALEYGGKALYLWNELGQAEDNTLGVLLGNIGKYYFMNSEVENARRYFQRALSIPSNRANPGIMQNIAACFFCQNQLDSAFEYYNNALKELAIQGSTNPANAISMSGMGITSLKLGYDSLALIWLERAWIFFDSTRNVEYLKDKLDCLNNFGSVYYWRYEHFKDYSTLYTAQQYFRQGMDLALDYVFQQIEYADLAEVLDLVLMLAENGIKTELQIYEGTKDTAALGRAWDFAEQSRSILLLNMFLENNASHFTGLPDSVIHALDEAKRSTIWLGKQLEAPETSDTLRLQYAARALVARIHVEELRHQIADQYPEFYRVRFSQHTLSLREAANMLKPDQTLMEYFTGDSSIFVFVVSKVKMPYVLEIKKDFPLESWIENFRQGLYGYYTLPDSQHTNVLYTKTTEKYLDSARKLYHKLIHPLDSISLLTERLVIVPDASLSTLPFEALLTNDSGSAKNFATLPYLVQKHQICYAYSTTSLYQMETKMHSMPPSRRLLALAPFATSDTVIISEGGSTRQAIAPLPNSGQEVEKICQILDGDALIGDTATAQSFFQRCSAYQILHLATHAQADQRRADYSYLVFAAPAGSTEKGLVYAKDLYAVTLNADLVTLSACESGIGKLQRGEGIISLARAFAVAGAKSIVSSLWVVSDKNTRLLMEEFYTNLKNGFTKDEALRQAKLKFLSTAVGGKSHPFFWAGLIAIGDMTPLH